MLRKRVRLLRIQSARRTSKALNLAQSKMVYAVLSLPHLLGALSKRATNPVDPEYKDPGHSQNLRQDASYAEPWKELPVKKTANRMKPEWKKSTVIPIIEDKKVEPNMKDMKESNTLTAAANVSVF